MPKAFAVYDEEMNELVRSGFFGQQLFESKSDAEEAAADHPERTVVKIVDA